MKLSLAWIFDHINASLPSQNIDELVTKFNEVSAEVDGIHYVSYDLKQLFVGIVNGTTATATEVFIPELSKAVELPLRKDAQSTSKTHPSYVYLIKQTETGFDWTNHTDFGQDRATPTPLMDLEIKHHTGSWRDLVGTSDVILEVDNKTITHRPDMWGHRGFAREIAAFMNLPLKETSSLIADLEKLPSSTKPTFTVNVQTPGCKRFMLGHISQINNNPANFKMAFRIMRLGMRSFNALVDITNYAMLDWSQPSHAFDASAIDGNSFIIRNAKPGEEITLLDGTARTLDENDMVVASPTKILSLAGIKGGLYSGVTEQTTSLALEVGIWDATTIRKTAFKVNLRTDAAARYEKTLSSDQAAEGMARIIFLAQEIGLNPVITEPIIDIKNAPYPQKTIQISHQFIEQRGGIKITREHITSILEKLGFKVSSSILSSENTLYDVEVPHWRASKDIAIAEDILEEIVRMYGFNRIPLSLPAHSSPPGSMHNLLHERYLRRYLAQSANMLEQKNYLYYDSNFTDQLGIDITQCLSIINPVSEKLAHLVHSLIPGLLKNVEDNTLEYDELAFFESNTTWTPTESTHLEQQRLAGIFFSKRNRLDFFDKKTICSKLFEISGYKNCTWKTENTPTHPWIDATQTATIWHEDAMVGYFGFAKPSLLQKLGGTLPESNAIIFDLNYEFLKGPKNTIVRFQQLPRYQSSSFDVSFLTPPTITYDAIIKGLQGLDPSIAETRLIDSFSKKDWAGKRSLTFRCKVLNINSTMTREEIDSVYAKVVSFAQDNQLTIRE